MRATARLSRLCGTVAAVCGASLLLTAVAQARLSAPGLQAPRNKSTVQALPAFTWGSVRGAAGYQFEFSANRNFSSGVNGFGTGPISLDTTAITDDDTIPDGTYYWRVRAMNSKGEPGRWSPMRRLTKHWSTAPKLLSPVSTTVNWPTDPLLLRWSAVPHAVNYQIEVGTSPQLSKLVIGPTQVQGPYYAFPGVLAPDTYYWAVQPIDAAGQLGARSAVQSFTWAWPSNTTLSETNVSPDSTYEEPSFSWTPIAGASSYEIQVSTDPSYPSDAIILDSTGLLGTNYTATSFFPNHTTLYWRLRAKDANGDAGSWNDGESFQESFDTAVPSVPNLNVVDASGNPLDDPTTSDPIVRWSPVPGASEYNVTAAPWVSGGTGCDFNSAVTISTANTDWTLGGTGANATWESQEYHWPGTANNQSYIYPSTNATTSLCISVTAVRSDAPIAGSTIESAPTIIGDTSQPAFTYQPATVTGTLSAPDPATYASTYSPGIVVPAYGGAAVSAGSTLTTAPLFEWQPVPGADGYYVIVANDSEFDPNSIVAGGFTNGTAWAPTTALADQAQSYWWEVIPVNSGEDDGEPLASADNGSDGDPVTYSPQPFQKNSVPPLPISPINGANVALQPTFSWGSAQGTKNYTLEVASDPSFASPIETDTTDSTSYTSTSTLPAGKTLYWRVRANDVSNNLNWSATQTFTHNLTAPTFAGIPSTGSTIPLLSWGAETGATGYNLQITTANGSSTTSVDTPYMTPTEFLSPGISKLQVQAVYPGGATSAYSPLKTYKRSIPAPSGIHATKSGQRILVTWNSDPIAKSYVIQLATNTGFGSPIAGDTTQNTAWVPQISAADASQKLYWRLAVIDQAGNTGAYHTGVFTAPGHAKTKKKKKRKKKR